MGFCIGGMDDPGRHLVHFKIIFAIESDFAIGTWSYQLTIDPDNDWSETNENNNVYTGTFEVCSSQCTDSDLKFESVNQNLGDVYGGTAI